LISTTLWRQLKPADFESLALEHVRDVYPNCLWRCTSLTNDGGKDAVGEFRDLREEISEIYWMEAKHHPASRSMGKYTLDTHLVSAFFSRTVKRLHVVTSAKLTDNFIHRADLFSKEHGFVFAYSDDKAVEAWLSLRHDIVHRFFGSGSAKVLAALEEPNGSGRAIFARALLIADNDSVSSSALPALHLLPGKKFRLVVSVSVASVIPREMTPLRLVWDVPPQRASLMADRQSSSPEGIVFDPAKSPIISIPFRLLTFNNSPLPAPSIRSADGTEIASLTLQGTPELPRLTSPFVGGIARHELLRLKRVLRDEVSLGRPRLIVCRGRAGSGKTRLAEELRDDAQLLAFTVRSMELSSTASAQEDRWRLLFRWLLGLAQNPFDLPEEEIIKKRLARLDLGRDEQAKLEKALTSFLTYGAYSEDLFNLQLPTGRRFAEAIRIFLSISFGERVLLHIDDAHHLSRRQLQPLVLLRHIIETSDSLSFCLILTARNDETVRDNSFAHFVGGLELAQFPGFDFIDLPDMTVDDAKELVVTTLRWPELLAEESKTLGLIVERTGTNPFFLMQTLDHLAVDRGTVAFGHGDLYFLIDIPAFKRALRQLPNRIRDILAQRFAGLLQRGERQLLRALAATAIIGRHAPRRLVNRALRQPLSTREVGRLLTLGYLADASAQSFELAHDLLVEALRERPEAQQVASHLASSIRKKEIRGLTEEQKGAIYYAAGRRYYEESWQVTRHLVESRARRQEYQSLPPLFERLERIAAVSRTIMFDAKLSWLAAIVDQHCGSTYAALQRFLKIKEDAEKVLPQNPERYIDSLIEIGNQHLLRAEATPALQNISEALEILNDSALQLSAKDRSGLETLAHNRYGAVLHLLERHEEALEHFKIALAKADGTGHHYLRSHTHWNIASLLRFSDPDVSQHHLQTARGIWNEKLDGRDRLGILIECSEAYVECSAHNTHLSRARLRAIAAQASEKGYMFQACNALLCFASCALKAEQWLEAHQVLLRALDQTVSTEDLRSRIFVTHYMSICAHMLGAEVDYRDWAWQAASSLTDGAFNRTILLRCLQHNENVPKARSEEVQGHYAVRAGDLLWYPYERA